MHKDTEFALNTLTFSLPDGWHEHTEGSEEQTKNFAITTKAGSAELSVKPVELSRAMPYGQDQFVVDVIHRQSIDDESGLIEVATIDSKTAHSVHAIFKRRVNDPATPMLKVFYSASLYVYVPSGKTYVFQFQAQEQGATGIRDAQVLAQAQREGIVTTADGSEAGQPMLRGWQQDPYDPGFTKGFLMNRSEQAEYDSAFPEHPLSLLRDTIGLVSRTVRELS